MKQWESICEHDGFLTGREIAVATVIVFLVFVILMWHFEKESSMRNIQVNLVVQESDE